jgi:ABC-2 type transport system ATP-binding protein
MNVIELKNINKEFKLLNRHEGLKGSIRDLFSRDYKVFKAVNNVTYDIENGEMIGYLGPNGAGKSTTIKIMTGILEPTSGTIIVNGKIPYKNRTENAKNIGVVFGQRSQLWWSLPAIESFKILKDIYRINDEDYKKQISLYESIVDIKPLYSKPIREMSLGQRTLCDILAAFLHNPGIVFLDEPTIGLDVSTKSKIRVLIKNLNTCNNTTVILTTHDIGDVDALCKRIIIIDKGTILYDNSASNLKSFFGAYRTLKMKLPVESSIESITAVLNLQYPRSELRVTLDEDWFNVLTKEDEVPVMEILQFMQKTTNILDIKIEEISTEDIIKNIYEGGAV